MSKPIYNWIIVYEDGHTETTTGENVDDFTFDLREVPVAIIRAGYY